MNNIRRVLRKPAVMAAFGIKSNSSFYLKIVQGFIPPGIKLDPAGRTVVWWEDEIAAIQNAATDRQASAKGA